MGEKSVFAPQLGSAQAPAVEKASKTLSWGAQPQQHCRQRCKVFYDTKGTKCGQGHAVSRPHRHRGPGLLCPPAQCHLPVCFSPITAPASQPRPHSRDTFVLSLCSVPPSFQLPAFLGTGSGQLGSAEHEAWCGMAPWDTACPPSICQPFVHVPAPLGAHPARAGEVGGPGWLGATRALCPSSSTARTQPSGQESRWGRVQGLCPPSLGEAPEAEPRVTQARPNCAAGHWGSI